MVNTTPFQIAGIVCMMIGGLLIGSWYRQRQAERDALKAIERKIERKQARKAARAERMSGGEEDEE